MKEFNIDKKGYNVKEVDDYIIMQQIETDRLLKEKQSRINELREENFNLLRELNILKQREESVSKALIASTEKAKEIEEKARLEYSLELKNLDMFYKKWNDFFNELITRYPKMKDFDTKEVLTTIKTEINDILNGTFQVNTKDERTTNFKNLIDKLHAHSKNKQQATLKINKTTKKETIINSENELEYQSETNKLNNIKPITNLTISTEEEDEFENLVDKFLHSDNKISKGYQNSILNSNKKKTIKKYPTPNESGFDLEEALNPTEDLISIMKGFKLD